MVHGNWRACSEFCVCEDMALTFERMIGMRKIPEVCTTVSEFDHADHVTAQHRVGANLWCVDLTCHERVDRSPSKCVLCRRKDGWSRVLWPRGILLAP